MSNGPKKLSLSSVAGKKLSEFFGAESERKELSPDATLENLRTSWKPGFTYPIPVEWINLENTKFKNRESFDEAEVKDLAHSIQTKGQQSPILVKFMEDGKPAIVFGWHRTLACQHAGLTVETRVTNVSDAECRQLALIENLIRRQLKPYEEAKAIFDLKMADNLPVTDIAVISEKDEKSIYAILKIFEFPVIVEALRTGRISSLTSARHLASKVGPRSVSVELQNKIISALEKREIRVQDIDYYVDQGEKLPTVELEVLDGGAGGPKASPETGGEGSPAVAEPPTTKTPAPISRNYFQKFSDGKISFVTPKLSPKTDMKELRKIQGEGKKFTENLARLIEHAEKAGKTEKKKGKKK